MVGPYRLVSLLGTGGFATVWRADGPEGTVALKCLNAHAAADGANARRFDVEAETLRRLDHPAIARCYRTVDHGGLKAIVMELIDGMPLRRDMLKRSELGEYFAWAEIFEIFWDIMGALESAHRTGVVHRDLKPGNIVRRGGPASGAKTVLLDFGVAKLTGSDRIDETTIGRPIGTLPYMAPEQHRSDGIGPAADLFAAGVLLFELSTLRRPWMRDGMGQLAKFHDNKASQSEVNNYPAILFRTTREARPRPDKYRLDIPEGVARLIEAALNPKIEQRPASAREFMALLESALQAQRSAGTLEVPRAPELMFDPAVSSRTVRGLDEAPALEGTPATPISSPAQEASLSMVVPSEMSDPEPSEIAGPEVSAGRSRSTLVRPPRVRGEAEARIGHEVQVARRRGRGQAVLLTAAGAASASLGLLASNAGPLAIAAAGVGGVSGYLAAGALRRGSRRREIARFREALAGSSMFQWRGASGGLELAGTERRYAKTLKDEHLSLGLRISDPYRVAGAPMRVTIDKPAKGGRARWEEVTGFDLSPSSGGECPCPIGVMVGALRPEVLQIADEDLKLLFKETVAAHAEEVVFTSTGLRVVIYTRPGSSPEHQVLSVYRACALLSCLVWWGEDGGGTAG
ncbi:MAG: serine/threonine-protein kinase [Myxococcota bacterium]